MKPRWLIMTCLIIGVYTLLAVTLSIWSNKYFYASSSRMIGQGFITSDAFDIASQNINNMPQSDQSKARNSSVSATEVGTSGMYIVSNHSRQTSYMLALHIAEQLTMSTSHFVEFMNLVHQWNFTGVEPVVYGSWMNALRSMHSEDIHGSVHYHQILNTSLMRNKLSKCLGYKNDRQERNSSQLFVPLSVFLRQSVRTITMVYFSKHINVLGKQLHAAADTELKKFKNTSGHPIVECTDILRRSGMSDKVEELFNHELIIEGADAVNFIVIQAFCIMPNLKISLNKIREDIFTSIRHDNFSMIDINIIFVSWQGKYTRPFTDMDALYHCRFPSSQIKPSQQVIATSDQFLKSLGLKKLSYIAIHIRFEKLFEGAFKHHKDPRHFLQCCMLKLNTVLKQLKEYNKLSANESTLLLHDYGIYGSDSCHQDGWRSRPVCVNQSYYLLSLLNETKAAEFDPIKFDAPKNSGFVSLVEGQALAGGETLVVVGGGSFQAFVMAHYTQEHKHERIMAEESHNQAIVYSLCTAHDNLHNLELDECHAS